MARKFLGSTISEGTLDDFESARMDKLKKDEKLISKSECVELALLMFIKKYGVKK